MAAKCTVYLTNFKGITPIKCTQIRKNLYLKFQKLGGACLVIKLYHRLSNVLKKEPSLSALCHAVRAKVQDLPCVFSRVASGLRLEFFETAER